MVGIKLKKKLILKPKTFGIGANTGTYTIRIKNNFYILRIKNQNCKTLK